MAFRYNISLSLSFKHNDSSVIVRTTFAENRVALYRHVDFIDRNVYYPVDVPLTSIETNV